jgi:hypothetical protein
MNRLIALKTKESLASTPPAVCMEQPSVGIFTPQAPRVSFRENSISAMNLP